MQISTHHCIVDVYWLIRIKAKPPFDAAKATALLLSTGIARLVTLLSSRRMRQHGKLSWVHLALQRRCRFQRAHQAGHAAARSFRWQGQVQYDLAYTPAFRHAHGQPDTRHLTFSAVACSQAMFIIETPQSHVEISAPCPKC
jgi:hypothetical protein